MARLDDGEPLLVQRNVGKGLVLMLGTSVQVNWSNLPLRTIFLPLVTQLTFDLADVEQTRANVIAGQPLVFSTVARPSLAEQPRRSGRRPTGGDRSRSARRRDPAAEARRTKTARPPRRSATPTRTRSASTCCGNSASTPPRQIAYSVNFDPDEAEPAEIEPAELEEQLGGAPLIVAENPDDLSATFARLREGKSLWGVFLTAVLIALVFETFLSNRFSPKQDDAESRTELRQLGKGG